MHRVDGLFTHYRIPVNTFIYSRKSIKKPVRTYKTYVN